MLEGKAVVSETDMRRTMQQEALHLASKTIDIFYVTEATDIARFIKKEFDRSYGSGWQCVVGNDFVDLDALYTFVYAALHSCYSEAHLALKRQISLHLWKKLAPSND